MSLQQNWTKGVNLECSVAFYRFTQTTLLLQVCKDILSTIGPVFLVQVSEDLCDTCVGGKDGNLM